MSAVADILEQAADALAIGHNDQLLLQPGGIAVTGYAQVLQADPDERGARRRAPLSLHVLDDLPTHKVVIRNSELTGVDIRKVATIEQAGGGKSYRVLHFTDDPLTSPDTEFYCVLA